MSAITVTVALDRTKANIAKLIDRFRAGEISADDLPDAVMSMLSESDISKVSDVVKSSRNANPLVGIEFSDAFPSFTPGEIAEAIRQHRAKRSEQHSKLPKEPIMDPEEAIQRDGIVCLFDGEKRVMLGRYVFGKYSMTRDEYIDHFKLRKDYPFSVDPNGQAF